MFERFAATAEELHQLAQVDADAIMAQDLAAIVKMSPARISAAYQVMCDRAYAIIDQAQAFFKQAGLPTPPALDVIGFDSGLPIAAGAEMRVTTTPQTVFKGTRIIVDDACADAFDIIGIFVGVVSQWYANKPISAALFNRANRLIGDLRLHACQISQQMIIEVRNKSDKPARFQAIMYGHTPNEEMLQRIHRTHSQVPGSPSGLIETASGTITSATAVRIRDSGPVHFGGPEDFPPTADLPDSDETLP